MPPSSTPHNRIRASSLLTAINPTLCIRCTAPKPAPGLNTLCEKCTSHLSVPTHDAERFLTHTCLRIYARWTALRRRLLADTYTVGCDLSGTFFEQRLGVPGTVRDMPRVERVWVPRGGEVVSVELCAFARGMLEEALLVSMQCDDALVLLAGVVRREMFADSSSVQEVEEVCFQANHPCVGSHWCYRVTLRDGRMFAVAFTDRQLGWLQIVRAWDAYVLERFDPWEMRDAIFYVENPDEEDESGERGVKALGLGSVWESQRAKWMHEQLFPWEVISRGIPPGWHPDDHLDAEKMIRFQKQFNYSLTVHKDMFWDIWAGILGDEEDGANL